MKELFFLLILAIIVSGCDLSSPEEASTGEISNALESIELAFNLHHLEEIMVYYDIDYLHNGDDYDNVYLDWEIRLNDYHEMELSDIEITLDGDRATVTLLRKYLVNGSAVEVDNSLAETGDISYWGLAGNNWKLRGNRVR